MMMKMKMKNILVMIIALVFYQVAISNATEENPAGWTKSSCQTQHCGNLQVGTTKDMCLQGCDQYSDTLPAAAEDQEKSRQAAQNKLDKDAGMDDESMAKYKTDSELSIAQAAKQKQKEASDAQLALAQAERSNCVQTDPVCINAASAKINDLNKERLEQFGIKPGETAATQAAGDCEKQMKEAEGDAEALLGDENFLASDVEGVSTGGIKKCVELTKGKFRNLYNIGGSTAEAADFGWLTYLKYSKTCLSEAARECKSKNIKVKDTIESCAKKNINLASSCDAAAFLMALHKRDWKDPSLKKATPVNGAIVKCSTNGIETLDFEACSKFSQTGDLLEVAQGAIQTGQQLYYADKTMSEQMNVANSTNSATAALKGMKSGIKAQEDMMNQKMAMDSAKAATLANYFYDMPDVDSLSAECKKSRAIPQTLNQETGCGIAILEGGRFSLLMNGDQKDKMKAKLVSVGINVVSDGVMANMMSQRVGDLDNAIAKVESFKPIDPLAPLPGNAQSTYCNMNPTDPKCLPNGLNRTFDAMGDNVISFGDGGTGTSYVAQNPQLNNTAGSSNPSAVSDKARTSVSTVGSAIVSANQKGGLADNAAAASITKGAAPTAGGGGGGGGGGASGGGGGGAPGAGQQGGTSAAIQGKTPSYGGGSGTLSMMGGFGINKSKSTAKADGNPFGKLFDKGGAKSGVVDFARSPASTKVGSKNDNIFEMISKRYTNVSTDKRLIEYEIAK